VTVVPPGVAVAAAVSPGTVERIVVVDRHPDVLVLIAELERMLALDPGEVHLGIEQGRILPLRVGGLAAEGGEAGDGDLGQAALDAVGTVCSPGMVKSFWPIERVIFAGLGARKAEARVQHLVGAE
jgi:hypothetical protein